MSTARDAQAATPDLAKLDRGGLALVLEHAWRQVRQGAEAGDGEPAYLTELKEATREMLVAALTTTAPTDRKTYSLRVDRDTLRLYFANLLLAEGKLADTYGGSAKPSGASEPSARVPASVAAEFRLQLARFMLGAVLILERGNAIDVGDPPAVSVAEEVDSLLYLIDRYVHVELGVDERLRVREHLTSGFTAEVELHLTKRFYRDHLLHVIDVFLLGHLLLRTRVALIDGEPRELLHELLELERLHPPLGVAPDDARLTPAVWLRDWAVAALLHDLGYQVMPTLSSEVDTKRLKHYFRLSGTPRQAWLGADSGQRWDSFVARLAEELRVADQGRDAWLPPPEAFEFKDHGVLSALRLAQVLVHAGSAEAPPGELDWTLLHGYRRALHASAHHNLFGVTVRLRNDPLACLLRLCDELQEWNRRRVNIEKSLKGLYLQIETGNGGLEGHECLQALDVNVKLRRLSPKDPADCGRRTFPADGIEATLDAQAPAMGAPPRFLFSLLYNDSAIADFEPTTTFLHKAYGLQHLDLCARAGGREVALHCRIVMVFPRPHEYGDFGELDLYALFTDQARELPRLRTWAHLDAGAGLWSLPDNKKRDDRVVIVLAPRSDAGEREGVRLRIAPSTIFDEFVKFKKAELERRRRGGGGQRARL